MPDLVHDIVRYQNKRGGAHRAGTLTTGPLERMEYYLRDHFKGRPLRSVETGCGASTILFSHYAQEHTAYCYDDKAEENSSVNFALGFPGLKNNVNWVFGPTQRTIFANPLKHDVDIVLIDGPHGYPFPELEYFAFYERLKAGGILIVDDIHIPTINNLYRFLMQDDGFHPHGITGATAYFQRSDRPAFNMEGDDWWLQRYNVQKFPARRFDRIEENFKLPVGIDFQGKLNEPPPLLARGFSLQNGRPVTEGYTSLVQLKLGLKAPTKLTFDVELTPAGVAERRNRLSDRPGFSVIVDGQEIGSYDFEGAGRRRIRFEAQTRGSEVVDLEFRHRGLLSGNALPDWEKSESFDNRYPNFWLDSIAVASDDRPDARPNRISRVDGSVMSFDYRAERVSFLVNDEADSVQAFHASGQFYEAEELERIRAHLPEKASILDVGAHLGNHTVFLGKFADARVIIPIEPQPGAGACLRINCALNSLTNVDFSFLGTALSDQAGVGQTFTYSKHNTGGTVIRQAEEGAVQIAKGDDLFAGHSFDFIKIDVEGMELKVLGGLAATIKRCRPILFVEVTEANEAQFRRLMRDWSYAILWSGQTYPKLTNFLLEPGKPAKPGRRWFWRS